MKKVAPNHAETFRRVDARSATAPRGDRLDLLGSLLRDVYEDRPAATPARLLDLARRLDGGLHAVDRAA